MGSEGTHQGSSGSARGLREFCVSRHRSSQEFPGSFSPFHPKQASSLPSSNPSSSAGQRSLNPASESIGVLGFQRATTTATNQLPLPDAGTFFTASPAKGPSAQNVPLPLRTKNQPQSASSKDATVSAEHQDDVIMAINVENGGNLGCAYYTATEDSLFLLHEGACTDSLQLLEKLMLYVDPTVVLLPLNVSDEVLHFFEDHRTIIDHSNGNRNHYVLRTLGSNDFNYTVSVDKLTSLPLICSGLARITTAAYRWSSGGIEDECENIKVMRLGSFIDLDCKLSVACAGAILGDIIRVRNTEPCSLGRTIAGLVRMFTLSEFMFVTKDTLSSLQIFQSELDPNNLISGAATSSSSSKESLSLYGIFHPLLGTPQGRRKLRQIFTRPLINLDEIRERQKTIAVFLRPDNSDTLSSMFRVLRRVQDIRKTLKQLQRGAVAPTGGASVDCGVWRTLTQFSLHSLHLRDAVLQLRHAHDLVAVQQVIEGIPVSAMKGIRELIRSVVEFDEAKVSTRVAVKSNVEPQLDRLKHIYHGLDSFLTDIRTSMSREFPEWARECVVGCVFWPQLGFFTVVSLRSDGTAAYEGQGLEDDKWKIMFVANGNGYCKNRRMTELDAQLGDPYSAIIDLEVQILHNLACRVLEHASVLLRAADICGALDCLVAMARGAQKYGWIAPTMTADNIIAIRGGRHPLQELAVSSFIANDCNLKGGSDSPPGQYTRSDLNSIDTTTLVITGPNLSGKSVYIKQVALIVYLAHLGSFVPADRATIGITDQLLTRISTQESISQAESAFGVELRQIAFLIKRATCRSLVVVDEFGKGTTPDDGSGLMAALIDHLTTLNIHNPKVLVTTHLHEALKYLGDRSGLSVSHMNVRLDLRAKRDNQIVFLYELAMGQRTLGFSNACAALNGVEGAVIERAEMIIQLLAHDEDVKATCARLNVEDECRLEEAERTARDFLQLSLQRFSMPHYFDGSRAARDRGEAIRASLGSLLVPNRGDQRE
ncbi:DNA mismatch repair protein [Colletotrichum truncatum]|uniref:DNA mismatch repair protein n=1 Tax=Colletotrichum truncatum TaxID=5467 RepID=A0ACC3YXG7_COLTU|nr:DNA mismatch repair protein [Colletotrichum truncatum]KAF6792398.1 DNA mismatch repair protein [Colletotrichum truncatum]